MIRKLVLVFITVGLYIHPVAAAEDTYLSIDRSQPFPSDIFIVQGYRDDCEGIEAGLEMNRYIVKFEAEQDYSDITFKKSVPSYSEKKLLGIDGPGISNAYDFAKFRIIQNGKIEIIEKDKNISAFKSERQNIRKILSADIKRYSSRLTAFGVNGDKFKERLERNLQQRYSMIFDINKFDIIPDGKTHKLDASIFGYRTYGYLSHVADYTASSGEEKKLVVRVESKGPITGHGRCAKKLLDQYKKKKTNWFAKMELAVCNMSWSMATTYQFSKNGSLKSIKRNTISARPKKRPSKSCDYIYIP